MHEIDKNTMKFFNEFWKVLKLQNHTKTHGESVSERVVMITSPNCVPVNTVICKEKVVTGTIS